MTELTEDILRGITETETAALNIAIDANGVGCPGPILVPWASNVANAHNEVLAQVVARVMSGQCDPRMMAEVTPDYLVLAFRVGYECGRQRLEVPPCEGH